ncbi:alanine racemase [Streptomyces sp. NPDC002540]
MPALVDLDIGMGRTGAATPEGAVAIAARLDRSARFAYAGLQAYSGRVQHIIAYHERAVTYGRQLDRLEEALTSLAENGLPPATVSGGGTGTFAIDVERKLYTESQAGSYCLMDVGYDLVELFPGAANPYRFALHLRTAVVSANQPGHVTVNAGFKSLATDGPPARVRQGHWPGTTYAFFGDEFGMIATPDGAARPGVGDIVDVQPSHCDPTINLHDFYHVVDDDTVVDIWPIDARGTL